MLQIAELQTLPCGPKLTQNPNNQVSLLSKREEVNWPLLWYLILDLLDLYNCISAHVSLVSHVGETNDQFRNAISRHKSIYFSHFGVDTRLLPAYIWHTRSSSPGRQDLWRQFHRIPRFLCICHGNVSPAIRNLWVTHFTLVTLHFANGTDLATTRFIDSLFFPVLLTFSVIYKNQDNYGSSWK